MEVVAWLLSTLSLKIDIIWPPQFQSLAQKLEIVKIGVEPHKRTWTFVIKGQPQGDQELWQELAQAVQNLVPEVSHVHFEWTMETIDCDVTYLEQAIQQVQNQAENGSLVSEANGPTPRRNGNGRRRGLLVNTIGGQAIALRDLVEEERNVVICGEVVSFDSRLTRTGKTLIMFDLYDGTDTLSCKAFLEEPEDLGFKPGDWLKVRGHLQFQSFDQQLSLMVQALALAEAPPALSDDAPVKRVELHLHTKMSGWTVPLMWAMW